MEPILRFFAWVGNAAGKAFGNPMEDRKSQPPKVGAQPFTGETGGSRKKRKLRKG